RCAHRAPRRRPHGRVSGARAGAGRASHLGRVGLAAACVVRSGRGHRPPHTVHRLLRVARRARQADAGHRYGAEPGGVGEQHRVRFERKEPWPDFLTFYATPATGAAWVVPRKYVEKVGDDGFKKAPVGAGPYKFVSFTPGVELVLEAHEQYWRKRPGVKRLVLKSVPDETTRL